MCHFWFNTAFVEKNFLIFEKAFTDGAYKVMRAYFKYVHIMLGFRGLTNAWTETQDKENVHFGDSFRVEVIKLSMHCTSQLVNTRDIAFSS